MFELLLFFKSTNNALVYKYHIHIYVQSIIFYLSSKNYCTIHILYVHFCKEFSENFSKLEGHSKNCKKIIAFKNRGYKLYFFETLTHRRIQNYLHVKSLFIRIIMQVIEMKRQLILASRFLRKIMFF